MAVGISDINAGLTIGLPRWQSPGVAA